MVKGNDPQMAELFRLNYSQNHKGSPIAGGLMNNPMISWIEMDENYENWRSQFKAPEIQMVQNWRRRYHFIGP